MLGRYYYHSIFRKSIISFGTLFNNILVKRKGNGGNLESLKVPIQYGPTQKFLAMIAAEPRPERQGVQMTLPRLSFEVKGFQYDAARKLAPTTFYKAPFNAGESKDNTPVQSRFLPVPYNLQVEMSYLKTQDDGLQILEQTLPSTLRSTFLSKS